MVKKRTLKVLYDEQRHLITDPYSLENLHIAARQLGIKRCWFHGKEPYAHYDLPKRLAHYTPIMLALRMDEQMLILEDEGMDLDKDWVQCSIHLVTPREIIEVIKKWRVSVEPAGTISRPSV